MVPINLPISSGGCNETAVMDLKIVNAYGSGFDKRYFMVEIIRF